jgi:hypothetical protein
MMPDLGKIANREGVASPLFYDVFGERVGVLAADAGLRRRIAATWGAFRIDDSTRLRAMFHMVASPGEGSARNGQQFNNRSLLVIADRHKLVAASLDAVPWQIHVETYRRSDEYVYYYLFEPLLFMVLKRRNLVHWHAAAVARRGRVVLIVGESGSGKSTTALGLLQGGFELLADDELFLRPGCEGVEVHSAEHALHLTDETLALMGRSPQLEGLPLVRRGRGFKRRLDASLTSSGPRTDRGRTQGPVRMVVFPRVVPADSCTLEPLSGREAMRRFVLQRPKEHPAVIPDAPSLERQFEACAALAETASCFDLMLGRDIERVPELLSRALE